jgi:tetratricopeptide (TPR) repeat protein
MEINKLIILIAVALLVPVWLWAQKRSRKRVTHHDVTAQGDVVVLRPHGRRFANSDALDDDASASSLGEDLDASPIDEPQRIPLDAIWRPNWGEPIAEAAQPEGDLTQSATSPADAHPPPPSWAADPTRVAAYTSGPDATTTLPTAPARRIPPRAACRLGVHFLHTFLDTGGWLPEGRALYTEAEARLALEQLEAGDVTATLPHGAVVCLINPRCALLVDPLLSSVDDEDRTLAALSRAVAGAQVYVVLGQLSEDALAADPPLDGHINRLLAHLAVPPAHLFYAIEDGSYHSYPEVDACFVPCRVDAHYVPGHFIESMLTYCLARLDAQEPEASLRVLGPLVDTLLERTQLAVGGFDALLFARVLNMLGLANRDMGALSEAITCFGYAVEHARPIGSPDDLQVLHKNLADALLSYAPQTDTPDTYLSSATEQLRHAIRIREDDQEASLLLGCTYIDRYRCTQKRSMLQRACSVLSQSLQMAPADPDILAAFNEAHALLQAHDEQQRLDNAPFQASQPVSIPDWMQPPRITLQRPQNTTPPPSPTTQRQPVQVQHSPSEQRRKPAAAPAAPSDLPSEPNHELHARRVAGQGGLRLS